MHRRVGVMGPKILACAGRTCDVLSSKKNCWLSTTMDRRSRKRLVASQIERKRSRRRMTLTTHITAADLPLFKKFNSSVSPGKKKE